jgi:hypothetical protein
LPRNVASKDCAAAAGVRPGETLGDAVGVDRILFSVDYPFAENPPGTE